MALTAALLGRCQATSLSRSPACCRNGLRSPRVPSRGADARAAHDEPQGLGVPAPATRGRVPFGGQRGRNVAQAATLGPEDADPLDGGRLRRVGDELTGLGPRAETRRAAGVAAALGVELATGPHPRRDCPPLEPGEHPHHLAHGGAHGVVGVVVEHLAQVHGVDPATVAPDLRLDSLLHGQRPGETIKLVDHEPPAPSSTAVRADAIPGRSQASCPADPFVAGDSTRR